MIEVISGDFLNDLACCDIDPAIPNCYDLVDAELKRVYGDRANDWEVVRPNHPILLIGVTWDEVKPVPCGMHDNCWHYAIII